MDETKTWRLEEEVTIEGARGPLGEMCMQSAGLEKALTL
jgi:hypothetical protein